MEKSRPTNEQSSPLPPYPLRLQAASFAAIAGAVLWVLEPLWSGLPPIGPILVFVFGIYLWRATRPPFGPYAPYSPKRRLLTVLAIAIICAFVITSYALAG